VKRSPQSIWSCDISIDQEIHMQLEKNLILGVKNKKKPSEPKNGIWGQNQYGRVIYPLIGNFT
jgi:hypothetical protein